jgi:hypothetical protein
VSVYPSSNDGRFLTSTDYTVGSGPSGLASADLDNDGLADLITANYYDGTVSILLGLSSNEFEGEVYYQVLSGCSALAVGNVDGVNGIDIVTADYDGSTAVVMRNVGDGTFTIGTPFDVGPIPAAIELVDVNQDLILDCLVANYNATSATVSVLLGLGNSLFGSRATYPVGDGVYGLAAYDVNQDTFVDIVTVNYLNDSVTVLLGNGRGSFNVGGHYSATFGASGLEVEDFNRDGVKDVVVGGFDGQNVALLLGRTNGSFQAPLIYSVGAQVWDVSVADENSDGIPDVVVATQASSGKFVTTLVGDANYLQFNLTANRSRCLGVVNATNAELAVVNALSVHGLLQPLVMGTTVAGCSNDIAQATVVVSVLLNDSQIGSIWSWISPLQLTATADFPAEGVTGVFVNAPPPTAVTVAPSPAPTHPSREIFADESVLSLPNHAPFAVAILEDDIYANVFDIVVADYGGQTVSVLWNDGYGSFSNSTDYTVGLAPTQVLAFDIDGNGFQDIVTANYGNNSVTILFNDGTNTFPDAVNLVAGYQPIAVAAGDVNHDTRVDIVVANYGDQSVTVLLNSGSDSRFSSPSAATSITFPVNGTASSLSLIHLNTDSNIDLVVVQASTSIATFFLGTGTGSFTLHANRTTGDVPYAIIATDLNGDGFDDAVSADYATSSLTTFLNDGAGNMVSQQYGVGLGPVALALADLDLDGRNEIIVANYDGKSVSVIFTNASGALSVRYDTEVSSQPNMVAMGDLNGDGVMDAVTPDVQVGALSLFFGKAVRVEFDITTTTNCSDLDSVTEDLVLAQEAGLNVQAAVKTVGGINMTIVPQPPTNCTDNTLVVNVRLAVSFNQAQYSAFSASILHTALHVPNSTNFPAQSATAIEYAPCDDGLLSNGEEEIDCGGPCTPCPTPEPTASPTTNKLKHRRQLNDPRRSGLQSPIPSPAPLGVRRKDITQENMRSSDRHTVRRAWMMMNKNEDRNDDESGERVVKVLSTTDCTLCDQWLHTLGCCFTSLASLSPNEDSCADICNLTAPVACNPVSPPPRLRTFNVNFSGFITP